MGWFSNLFSNKQSKKETSLTEEPQYVTFKGEEEKQKEYDQFQRDQRSEMAYRERMYQAGAGARQRDAVAQERLRRQEYEAEAKAEMDSETQRKINEAREKLNRGEGREGKKRAA